MRLPGNPVGKSPAFSVGRAVDPERNGYTMSAISRKYKMNPAAIPEKALL